MRVKTLLLIGVFEIAGCGAKTPTASEALLPLVAEGAPIDYPVADQACQNSAEPPVDVTSSTTYSWWENAVHAQMTPFVGFHGGPSLTTGAINSTSYADVFERFCDAARPVGHECDDKDGVQTGWSQNVAASKGPLRICKDGTAFGRLTYEGVALTSAQFIQTAHDRYVALANASGAKAPQAVHLAVFPKFTDTYDHAVVDGKKSRVETFITHNLAYFPGNYLIAVFPESAESAPKSGGFFWESQFVLGHEYGHHIDFTRHGEVLASVGLRWSPMDHGFIDEWAAAQDGSSISPRAQMAGALSEAFADLMGYYAAGGSAVTLSGLATIGFDRDISKDAFHTGEAKVLTDEHIAHLFGNVAPLPRDSNTIPYEDIHMIGAIVAHAADRAFAGLAALDTTAVNDSVSDTDLRYRLTLSFMDELVARTRELGVDASGSEALAPLGAALQTTAVSYVGTLGLTGSSQKTAAQAAVCGVMRDELPALAPCQ